MLRLKKIIKRLLLIDLFFPVRFYTIQIGAFLVRAILVKRLQHLESETKGTPLLQLYPVLADYNKCPALS